MRNRNYVKKPLLAIILFLSAMSIHGQGLMNIYTGISARHSADLNVTPENTGHYGHFVGLDLRLDGGMYFMGGGRIYRTSIIAETEKSFTSNAEHWYVGSMRGGLGFNLFRPTYRSVIRARVLGSFQFSMNFPENTVQTEGYETVNGTFAGVIGGIGVDLSFITIDLEYQKGLVNAYFQQPDSTFDVWSLAIGFAF